MMSLSNILNKLTLNDLHALEKKIESISKARTIEELAHIPSNSDANQQKKQKQSESNSYFEKLSDQIYQNHQRNS